MPKYIKRWLKIRKGIPAYEKGYRWFDAKDMTHHKKKPAKATIQVFTKYSLIRHG